MAGAALETPAVRAQTVDPAAGVVLGDSAPAGPTVEVTCTLTLTPNVVNNGDKFAMRIAYSEAIGPGSWTEKFILKWPSKVDTFAEKSVHTKIFKNHPTGGIIGSVEDEVAPIGLNIEGTFPVKVKVKGLVNCTATADLTVNNP